MVGRLAVLRTVPGARFVRLLALAAIAALAVVVPGRAGVAPVRAGVTYTVDANLDTDDAVPGDGFCDEGRGFCTLRAAIDEVNAGAGGDRIEFSINSITVPSSNLPIVLVPVTIDGSTQCATPPCVSLRGTGASVTDGIVLAGGASTIRGLALRDFSSGSGIVLSDTGGDLIAGNYIGTRIDGATAASNGTGIYVASATNTIGGTTAADRNVISGNIGAGIFIDGGNGGSATTISGNYIGATKTGFGPRGNGGDGITISGANGAIIGDGSLGARNTIISNGGSGISIEGDNNSVAGNLIGTDPTNDTTHGNSQHGVSIVGGNNNKIGTLSGFFQIISGNLVDGIHLSGTGTLANQIRGNFIGTGTNGEFAIKNTRDGIGIDGGAHDNIVGAFNVNLISGNGRNGVLISGSTTKGNSVSYSTIGLDFAGTVAMPNIEAGVRIDGAPNNTVGSNATIFRNTISGNGTNGVMLTLAGTTGTKITGNYIGTNTAGTAAIPNSFNGIAQTLGTTTTIGGSAAGERNIISGNTTNGVIIAGNSSSTIAGNYIGTNVSGDAAIANQGGGIQVQSSDLTTIGGVAAGAGNVISGNSFEGIVLSSSDHNTTVLGNLIGTKADGTSVLGNDGPGVFVGGHDNLIGAATPGGSNTIADNNGDGVLVDGAGATNNAILNNSLHDNAGKAISLTNGANGGIQPPTITGVTATTVSGTSGCQGCGIIVFSDNADEGRIDHGLVTTTDASGNWNASVVVSGPNITAAMTFPGTGATSELRLWDSDGDGIGNGFPKAIDNCPNVANANQLNTDSAPLVTPAEPNDVTIARSDTLGDVCDPDDDNDGLFDGDELVIGPGHLSHFLCPSASADLDPLKSDTDGDHVLDGAECALGSDPANAASKPAVPAAGTDPDADGLSTAFEMTIGSNPNNQDSDGDKIPDGVEYKGYNTSPTNADSDGDGCPDGREVASMDGNHGVSSTDLLIVAKEFGRADRPVQDLNKNGIVNSSDLLLAAQNFGSSPC